MLPIAWEFNYAGLFNDMKAFRSDSKRGRVKKQVKRPWNNVNLNKLAKRYDELALAVEEFKETDSEADKLAVIAAKNFVKRIQHHLKDLQKMVLLLNVFSFSPMLDILPEDKAQELACLLQLGATGQLRSIQLSPRTGFTSSWTPPSTS